MFRIGIFSGSKDPKPESSQGDIVEALREIGSQLPTQMVEVHYGGGESGLMGFIPRTFEANGGSVVGHNYIGFDRCKIGKEIMYPTFDERQLQLILNSDVILVLPGGVGTASELFDVLVRNDVGLWSPQRKVILFNYKNFFEPIYQLLENGFQCGFVKKTTLDNIVLTNTVDETVRLIRNEIVDTQ